MADTPKAHNPLDDPFAPGSLGALAPSWWEPEDGSEPEPWLDAEEAYERFLEWVEARGIEPWPHQEEALFALAAGSNVVLGTPTGSGKSLVATGLCFMALASGQRAYYTAPIKALVSEKFFYLVDILGRDNVGMITGDSHINTGAPVICCTAEILANQALREGEETDVACVVMDEFHFFADVDRGWAWQVPLLTLPHAQFLLMSATLGNMDAIAAALERHTGRDVEQITHAPRPVPLSYEYVLTPLEGTVELALREGKAPLYIVHFSQDAALASAKALASYGVATKAQREAIKDAVKGSHFTTAFGKTLKRLILCGVGLHHAGMLPRYRLLVEKLAQQGLLPVICGTDTLGVGINVPIHTVLLTGLTKFDGHRQRRLRSREFHQIAGRAGRAGFDTEGVVISLAPEHEIENHKLVLKCEGDPKKLRKLKKKRPPEGFVSWNEGTFNRLIEAEPETLKPRLRITNSMVLAEAEQGGDAWARLMQLIDDSLQTDLEKIALRQRAAEILATLIDTGVVVREAEGEVAPLGGDGADEYETPTEFGQAGDEEPGALLEGWGATENLGEKVPATETDPGPAAAPGSAVGSEAGAEAGVGFQVGNVPKPREGDEGPTGADLAPGPALEPEAEPAPAISPALFDPPATYYLTVDLPEDFALDQPLSPFLLAALELLDPESETYALDLISMVEATLEDPKQVLRAQERAARDAAMAAMKAEGLEFEERVEKLKEVSYPKPLEELLGAAFERYCVSVPWARDYEPSPKSVLRDMLEGASDFKGYIARYNIARCEGILLRYLTEAYRALDRTVPLDKRNEQLDDIVAWLGVVVRSVDSSLVDEWEHAGEALSAAPPKIRDEVVADRRGLTVLVRNALFLRVKLAQQDDAEGLGALDEEWGWGKFRWQRALDAFYDGHEDIYVDNEARSMAYLNIDVSDELSDHVWHVHQVFCDTDEDHDFGIKADVDLDATQDGDGVVFKSYRAGFIEDLL